MDGSESTSLERALRKVITEWSEDEKKAIDIVTKALQLNGRRGIGHISHYIHQAGVNTPIRKLLEKSRDILLERKLLSTKYEESTYGTKLAARKSLAQIRRRLKYMESRYSPLPTKHSFRLPDINDSDCRLTASSVVMEATRMIDGKSSSAAGVETDLVKALRKALSRPNRNQ